MTRALTATIALLLTIAVASAGCGGNDQTVHGVDTSDPKAVAQAVKNAVYNCGEDGQGLLYDLRLPSQRTLSRKQVIANEQAGGCRPETPPAFDVIETGRQGDQVAFEITSTDEDGDSHREPVVVVKTPDGYRFDNAKTKVERDPSDP